MENSKWSLLQFPFFASCCPGLEHTRELKVHDLIGYWIWFNFLELATHVVPKRKIWKIKKYRCRLKKTVFLVYVIGSNCSCLTKNSIGKIGVSPSTGFYLNSPPPPTYTKLTFSDSWWHIVLILRIDKDNLFLIINLFQKNLKRIDRNIYLCFVRNRNIPNLLVPLFSTSMPID